MRVYLSFLLLFGLGCFVACQPRKEVPIVQFSPGVEYALLSDPWSRYLGASPKLYILPKLSDNVRTLLEEEQALAQVILSGSGRVEDRVEYLVLNDVLDELKSAVPSAATRTSNYTRSYSSSGTRSYAYSSSSGYSYARNGGGGSSGYSTVFKRVHRSSSPALARSVENVVLNATLEDIGQRVDALDSLITVWSRKTEVMSLSGIDGAMRSANLDYLASLETYADDFRALREEIKKIEGFAVKDASLAKERLVDWQTFEGDGLVALDRYVQNYATHVVDAISPGRYQLPVYEGLVILGCKIGERTLYFNLSQVDDLMHPFRLVVM